MSWLETKLFAGEKIIFRCRTHKSIFLLPFSLLFIAYVNEFSPFLFIGITILLFDILKYFYREFIVTNKRVIIKKGFFHKHISDIAIESISEVTIYQSFSEKFFRTGRVTIFGESITNSTFKDISRAKDFRNAVYSQLPVTFS
ncbi:MAG TPA: PH domain-containing protein [Balneolaceae bacterium]